MTAREMRPQDVPHEYVMASMRAFGLITAPGAREALAIVLPMHRAEVLREAAELGRDWSREGYSAQEIANRLDRMADAATPTSNHSCGNCDGVDPGTCLMNPHRVTPTSKEQQR